MAPPAHPLEIAGLSEFAGSYDAILCDIWGVVHDGRACYAAACESLSRFRQGGGAVVLITNAPRPSPPVREQLDRLGAPRAIFDDLVTSGDVTLSLIAERGDAPVHHIGPERDLTLFEQLAATTGHKPPLTPLEEADYVVCTGLFRDDVERPEDYDAALATMLSRGAPMICANPDLVVHVGDTLIYCSGALAERYQAMGGVVLQAGKPFRPIYERAFDLAARARGGALEKSRTLAIGDGLLTDVKGASGFGLDVLFITAGIHRHELHATDALDAEALTRALSEAALEPKAAMPALAW